MPQDTVYLRDLAEARLRSMDEWKGLRGQWITRFHAVHFERYSKKHVAAVAEVTPYKPPYDYRSQEPRTRRGRKYDKEFKRNHNSTKQHDMKTEPEREDKEGRSDQRDPKWTYWREVIITSPPDVHLAANYELGQLASLYLRASNYTDPEDAAYCHRLLRPLLGECIDYYDCDHPPPVSTAGYRSIRCPGCGKLLPSDPGDDPILISLRQRRAVIERIYERSAARRTVTQYTAGMVVGLFLLPLFVLLNFGSFAILDRISGDFDLSDGLKGSVHIGTILGAIGAVSSVLLRITSSSVDLDLESTRHGPHVYDNPVMQRGLARVLIGIIFGGIAAWFVHAGVLVPDGATINLNAEQSAVLIGVFAYISGFSERFIPDLILRTSRGSAMSFADHGPGPPQALT